MIAAIFWDIGPQIFGDTPYLHWLRWYGTCWGIGLLVAYRMLVRIYTSEGIPLARLDKLTTYLMVGILLGARLGHILFYDPAYYFNNPIEILPFRLDPTFQFTGLAGLASHGGILGALLALYAYTSKYPTNYLWLLDRLTVAGAILGGFIRLGNLMNSEIIGSPADVPWAFVFNRVDMLPRHPAQLYEALFYFGVGSVLYILWKRGTFQAQYGFLAGLGLSLIFVQRFLVEFLKEDQVAFEQGLTLNMGQWLSIPLVMVGVLLMVWSKRRSKNTPA